MEIFVYWISFSSRILSFAMLYIGYLRVIVLVEVGGIFIYNWEYAWHVLECFENKQKNTCILLYNLKKITCLFISERVTIVTPESWDVTQVVVAR